MRKRIFIVLGTFTLMAAAAVAKTPPPPPPVTITGCVSGIDVITWPSGSIHTLAFINPGDPHQEIQVETTSIHLQSGLETATLLHVKVEAMYTGDLPKKLTRVRILDRDHEPQPPCR